MTTQSLYPDVAVPRSHAPRDEKLFFDLVGPALKDEPLTFLCGDREYRYGTSDNPTVVRINDTDVFRRVLTEGNLGLGESYMTKKVEIVHGQLENLMISLVRADVEKCIRADLRSMWKLSGIYLRNMFRGRYGNVQAHYDVGDDLFDACLDETMAYSCGYARSATDSLAQLQTNKFDRICRKLRLQPGDRLLDIGCGFGGLLIHAAKNYGARGTGITISHVQHQRGQARVEEHGLKGEVEIRYASHQTLPGQFDKIVSVGMFEHLTKRDYPVFFGNIKRALADGGLGLLHTIGCNTRHNPHDPFTQKYIFPGSRTPTLSELAVELEKCDLPVHDVENIGRHYAPTMRRWNENFQRNYHKLDHAKYDETFKRMWEYYLAMGVGAATASTGAVFQVLFANSHKIDIPYQRV